MSCRGFSKRVRSPNSATVVTATVNWTPCRAWRASTTGAKRQVLHLLVECEFQTSQTFSLFGDGLDVCLKDDLLRRCGTHHLAEPAQVGGTPVGPPRRADIVPQQEGFEPQLGRLQIPQGLFPRPTQVADRCIVEGRDIDRGEVPGAHEPGQLHGVPSVGFHPVARLFRNQRGSDHPADVVFFGQITIEPIPTWTGFIDKDEVFGLGLQLPNQGVDVTGSSPSFGPSLVLAQSANILLFRLCSFRNPKARR